MLRRILIFIIPLFISISVSAQVQIEWTAVVGINYDETTGSLTKTETDGWNNAGARSLNRLDANEDGIIRYVINDLTTEKAIGLSTKNNNQKIKSLDYAMVFNGSKLSVYESGIFRGQFGKIKVGDELSIEREGNKIIFRKNGKQFRKRNTNPGYQLFADVAIFTQGAILTGITASFYKPLKIINTKQDLSCNDALNGAIDITIDGGKPPYTYLWSNGATTEDLSNLDIGKYNILVTDANGKQKSKNINILSKIIWTDLEGVEVVDGNLIKVKSEKFKEGAAASVNVLNPNQDGKLVYEVEDQNYTRVIGLTRENVFGKGYFDTDYAVFLSIKGTISIFERGKLMGEFGKYVVGDEIIIKRQDNTILIKKNKDIIYKTGTEASQSLRVDVALLEIGATLNNLRTNFCNIPFSVNYSVINEKIDALGSINLIPISGTPPYTYKWEDGDSTQNRTNLPSGIYKVEVIDNSNEKVNLFVPVGVEIQWKQLDEFLVYTNEELRKTSGNENWEKSKAVLLNEPIGNGEVMAKVIELGVEWTFGYTSEEKVEFAKHYTDLLYGLYVDKENKLYSTDREAGLKNIGTVTQGDFISIKMVESKVVYFKNGVEIGVSKFNQNKFKILFLLNSLTKTKPISIGHTFWPKIIENITNTSCTNDVGAISLNTVGGSAFSNYQYIWKQFNFNTGAYDITLPFIGSTASPIGSGWYQVNVTADFTPNPNALSFNKTYNYIVGKDVEYTDYNVTDIQVIGTEIKKISASQNFSKFTSTINEIDRLDDGWLIIKKTIDGGEVNLGLVWDVNSNVPYYVDHGFLFSGNNGSGSVKIKDNNSPSNLGTWNYSDGDRFAISKTGNVINYWQNEVLIHSSFISPVGSVIGTGLKVSGSLLSQGDYLKDVIVNFCKKCAFTVLPGEYIELCPDENIQLLVPNPKELNGGEQIGYFSWEPLTGLSCTTCPNPTIDVNTAINEYTVLAYQYYGTGINPNLVVNGTFDTDLSGWGALPNNSWIWNSGKIQNNGGVGISFLEQNILTIGEAYEVGFDISFASPTSGPGSIKIFLGSNEIVNVSPIVTNVAGFGGQGITLNSTVFRIEILGLTSSDYSIDNVSVKKLNQAVCGHKTVTVVVKEDCDQDILGCCFGNFGAGVYVSPSTNLNVYCNLLNEVSTASGTLQKGEFRNQGDINVWLDWINNGKNGLFITQEGITDFIGYHQEIKGNSSTYFNKLQLGEDPSSKIGVKDMFYDQYVYEELDVQNNEIATNDYTLSVVNPAINAIIRGNGASSIGGTGFVSTDGDGYLKRAMINGPDKYFFPMGSRVGTQRYRPLDIQNNTPNLYNYYYSVSFKNYNPKDPSKDHLIGLAPNVSNINDKYFHKVKADPSTTLPNDDIVIRSYYNLTDGDFNSLSHWRKNIPTSAFFWWKSAPAPVSNLSVNTTFSSNYYGLVYAQTTGNQEFDNEPFVLSKAGFTVNTGEFGNDGTTVTIGNGDPITTGGVSGLDSDGDGKLDEDEIGGDPDNPIDTDGDGIPDYLDIDSDGDGINDVDETFPCPPVNGNNYPCPIDADGDGTIDDPADADGDGIPDVIEGTDDFDGDGVPNYLDCDSDGDGVPDSIEGITDTEGIADTDGDGSPNYLDITSNGGFDIFNSGYDAALIDIIDSDDNGVIDNQTDTDGDCIPDIIEIGDPNNPIDTDGDGTPDYLDNENPNHNSGGIVVPDDLIGPKTEIITITTNDCGVNAEIHFTIADGLIDEESFEFYYDGGMKGKLSPELFAVNNINLGISIYNTPQKLIDDCVNSINVSLGNNNDFVLDNTENSIVITSPTGVTGIGINSFTVKNKQGTVQITETGLSLGTHTHNISTPLLSGVYSFEMEIEYNNGVLITRTIKGQFIVK